MRLLRGRSKSIRWLHHYGVLMPDGSVLHNTPRNGPIRTQGWAYETVWSAPLPTPSEEQIARCAGETYGWAPWSHCEHYVECLGAKVPITQRSLLLRALFGQ